MSYVFDLSSLRHCGHETLTVAGTTVTLTASAWGKGTSSEAVLATIQVLDQPIRYSPNPTTTPTASVGKRADANERMQVWGRDDLSNTQFIREGASSATLEVDYYKLP